MQLCNFNRAFRYVPHGEAGDFFWEVFTAVFQGNGSANFDGLSKVTINLTTDTAKSIATPVTWSGTYSMQANCVGVITITSGGSATLNIVSYAQNTATAQAADFLVTGNDSVYSYSGSGNAQPSGCSAATLSGVYVFTGTGYNVSSGSVTGATAGTGLLQFDGISNITVNFTKSTNGQGNGAGILTGSYSVSANCLGSATLTASPGGTFMMSFSVTNVATVNSTTFDVTLANQGSVLVSGAAHPVYGQPTSTASDRGSENGPQI